MYVWAQKQSKDSYYNNSSSDGKYNKHNTNWASAATLTALISRVRRRRRRRRCWCRQLAAMQPHLSERETDSHTQTQWARIKFVRACKRECAAYVCVCVAYCSLCWCWLVLFSCLTAAAATFFSSKTCFEPATTTVKCLPWQKSVRERGRERIVHDFLIL